jgi:hypothetical protein
MRKLFVTLFAVAMLFAFNAAPASGIIVHHCDYTPPGVEAEVHDRHNGKLGCGNVDSSGDGQDGECQVENSFYWADVQCDASGCIMMGKIDCGANDKTYYFTCPGNGSDKARVEVDRYTATCDSPNAGQDHDCTCAGACS